MTNQEQKVATENVTGGMNPVVDESEISTAQDLAALISVTNVDEASKLLNLPDTYDVPTMLRAFEREIYSSIDNKRTQMLKQLTEAKNILLRAQVEAMVEENGRFDLSGMIPYAEACISCKGTGEIYKFFRNVVTVPCKFCTNGKPEDNGFVFIPCRACNGTKRYKKYKKGLRINVACTRCYKDENGLPTGQERIKCRACLGKGRFRKLVIDSKIKSTTKCHHCKGRGFLLPKPQKPKVKRVAAEPANPVISADLGKKLKQAKAKE